MAEPVPEPVTEPIAEPRFTQKIGPEDFGGKEFWENLILTGLIKKECPVCHQPAEVAMYGSKNWVPLTKCPEHLERSCLAVGFFKEFSIKEPAKFVQFARGYVGRMSSENAQMFATVAEKTSLKFVNAIEDCMDEYIVQKIQAGEMVLGGDRKVVEIDEKELTINKYNRGRLPSKKITVFGMVEIDDPAITVQEVRIRAAVRKEEARKAERMGRLSQSRRDLRRLVPDETAFVVSTAQTEAIVGQE